MFSALVPPSFSEKGNRGSAIRCWTEAFFGSLFWEQVGGVLEAPCSCKQSAINSSLPLPFYLYSLGFGVAILGSKPLIDKIHMKCLPRRYVLS